MKLYTVILVDDEEEVRQAIIHKLDWESIGFQVIGSADNGEDALEIAERLRPDVVLTDIKMPFMDGLTLSRKLKQISKDIKVIIFSGFDDFEYAKEAIKLEVEEYILKPINAEELKEVFIRVKVKLDNEINSKRDIERLRAYYEESIPVMKEQLLIGLLEKRVSRRRFHELMNFYGFNMEAPYYMAGIVRMESVRQKSATEEDILGKTGLLTLSLKQIVDENLQHGFEFVSCLYLDSIVVIAMFPNESQVKEFIHSMDQICKSSNRILERNTNAGIGYLCKDIMELSHSYRGAKNAIDYRILFEPNQAIYIQDVEKQEGSSNVWDSKYTEVILREIKLGEVEDLIKAIQDLIGYIKNSNNSFQLYQVSLMEMMTEIFKLGRNYQLDMDMIFGSDFNINTKIYQFATLDALKEWLMEVCLKVRGSIRRERTDSAKLLINKAVDYLNQHYGDSELSVDTLCNYLNVSATYFSVLFKRETGMSFVNYLTKVRMEKALQLLNTTDEKSYNISTMVGYTEPNYFSYVFKKYYGVSPSNYRKIV